MFNKYLTKAISLSATDPNIDNWVYITAVTILTGGSKSTTKPSRSTTAATWTG